LPLIGEAAGERTMELVNGSFGAVDNLSNPLPQGRIFALFLAKSRRN
jgi:hypothetical protein